MLRHQIITQKGLIKLNELPYTIDDLKEACKCDRIKWSMHIFKRFRERHITHNDFTNAIYTGEIIESYPEDYIAPSCLISGLSIANKPLHTVQGYNNEYIYAVTAYYPDINEWGNDYKTRRVN